jgi:uncharacterized membrane protein YozB (DUF420 family)
LVSKAEKNYFLFARFWAFIVIFHMLLAVINVPIFVIVVKQLKFVAEKKMNKKKIAYIRWIHRV